MGEIKVKGEVKFEREKIYTVFRDKIEQLVPYLDDVEDIKVLEREELGENRVKLVNMWKAKYDKVPQVGRSFIKPDKLKWTDYARWNQDEWTCEWQIVPDMFPEAISCEGKNTFVDKGNGVTEVIIEGKLDLDIKKVPGVPKLGAGKIGKAIEGFVVPMISSNLSDVLKGIESFISAEEG